VCLATAKQKRGGGGYRGMFLILCLPLISKKIKKKSKKKRFAAAAIGKYFIFGHFLSDSDNFLRVLQSYTVFTSAVHLAKISDIFFGRGFLWRAIRLFKGKKKVQKDLENCKWVYIFVTSQADIYRALSSTVRCS